MDVESRFLQLHQLHNNHLEDSTTWFLTEYHLIFRQNVANRNLVDSIIYSIDFLSIRCVFQECICISFLSAKISVNVHFWSAPKAVSWDYFHSCCVFRFISRSCYTFPRRNLFRVGFYDFLTNELLLLHKCITLARSLESWTWKYESFE